MPVNGGSDIEDVDPHQMVFEDDDHLFDEEEDQLTLDDESGYMYSAKMIYPPMEIDSDSDGTSGWRIQSIGCNQAKPVSHGSINW